MESLDPPKNIANVGTSKSRISSILKAPRTSAHFADPVHVETPVKVAMPVEKRNSRRVSFAPATDVLLFSKEKRNGSPVRSPLQDLSATNTPDNRNPIGVIENGIQPVTDMETLLNAPLHSSQQRKEVFMVSHDAEDHYGEKTMVFSADDAIMDVTHSHTMIIANDSDLPDQHGEMLSTCGKKDFFFSMGRGKSEPCILPKTPSSSVHSFDPEFKNLLASFSKPSGSRDNSMLHKVEQNASMMPHDKENQAPTSTKRENLSHKTVKIGESSNRGIVFSKDTQGLEMTDVFTGHILENAAAEDPLQCPFPTLDLHRRSEHRMMGVSSLKMGNSLNLNLTQTCPLPENRLISQNMSLEEYASRNTSESDDMDMTRSQTVAIDSRSLHAVTTLTKQQQEISRFSITAPYKSSTDFENDMDSTSCQTFMSAFTKACTQNTSQEEYGMEMTKMHSNPLFSEDAMDGGTSRREGFERYNCESDDMEMTKSQTVAIDAKKLNAVNPLDNKRRKSLAFMTTIDHKSQSSGLSMPGKHLGSFFSNTEPAVDTDMDLTRSQTRLIDVKSLGLGNPSLKLASGGSISVLDSKTTFKGDSKAMERGANQIKGLAQYNCESDMEMTKSQTVAIDTKNLNSLHPLDNKKQMSLAFMTTIDHKSQSSGLSMPGKYFGDFPNTEPAVDTDMDLTRSQTRLIDVKSLGLGNPSLKPASGGSIYFLDSKTTFKEDSKAMERGANQIKGLAQYNCESDDMEMTKSQTVAIDTKNLNSLHPLDNKKQMSLAFHDHTIDHKSQSSGLSMPGKHLGSFFSNTEPAVDTDMDLTRSQTRLIEAKPQICLEDTRAMEREGLEQYNCESDDMEITKSQTVAIDAKNLNALNPLENKRRKSLAFVAPCAKVDNAPEDGYCNDKIQTNTEADSDMEFTRCQTRLIQTKHLAFVKPSLKISSGRSFPTLDSNTHPPISINAVENTKSSHHVTNIFPEANQENDALCSDDMELTRSQTVALNCKSTGISNIVLHKARKSLPFLKQKSAGMDVNGFHLISTELQNPDDLDITRSHTVTIESKDVHSPDDASLKHSQVTGPLEGLSYRHSGSAGELGLSHGLTDLGDMELTQNGTIPIELNQEPTTLSTAMSMSLDGKVTKVSDLTDQLDPSQNAVKSISLSVDKYGASSESTTMQNKNGSELRQENSSLSCGLESASCINSAVDGVDETSSTKTRRMTLVDLQFKLRRMSRLPNEPTEKFSVDDCDAPLSQPKMASDIISDKTQLLTAPQHNPEMQRMDNADYTHLEQFAEEDQPCVTAPLNLNRKSLTSRLSLGNFLPKLPQKIKPADPNKVSGSGRTSVEEHENKIISVNITHQLSSGMIDIVDEVLPNISSDEDLSESLVTKNPQSTSEDGSPLQECDVQGMSEEEVWELSPGHPSVAQGKKRPSPVEDTMLTDKRKRPSLNRTIEMPNQSPEKGKCIGTFPLAPAFMIQALDAPNSSNTAHLRSETTFESTLKQSLFESQLEDIQDYTNDFQKNVDDERITVAEFFKLFNVDFVIHNPRQSVLPGKLTSHVDHTPEDLLKNRHINHPKQRVYELDHQNLADKVERLKARMKDQGRLLHSVNKPLWEELICLSEEEMKCFGAKLKESSNFFRKRSKAQSHEMKAALYSDLLQANLEERQKLREKVEEADGMLNSLDDCIQELETELAAVEGDGLDDDKQTLKSRQRELENVTMELADKERQMCEMEMQKKCNMDQVRRLQTKTQDLNGHIEMLHRVNEWTVAERKADGDVYSFLYGSLHLEVAFDMCAGKGPEEEDERNILDINFKLALDEEKSACHARLVHKLLSEFTGGRSDWVEKYPSKRWVPKLLHDVGLVVSRCRLLSEEVRLLRTWGALRFDILDIRCVDTRVHIVFSSLEAMAKFELSLAVTQAYPCCPLQMQDFRSHIGSTTAHRVEEIVSSVSPGKNYLTRIVKAVHAAVLS